MGCEQWGLPTAVAAPAGEMVARLELLSTPLQQFLSAADQVVAVAEVAKVGGSTPAIRILGEEFPGTSTPLDQRSWLGERGRGGVVNVSSLQRRDRHSGP